MRAILHRQCQVPERYPSPAIRQIERPFSPRSFRFPVLPTPNPFRPALFKNPLQKPLCCFIAAPFAAGEFGFGFDETAFDGGFEDGGFVAFEVGFDALEVGDGFVEAGELFFEFGDDFALLL